MSDSVRTNDRDHDRMNFVALKIKAGVPLTPEEQEHWEQHVHLGDKVNAGLPLTPDEQYKLERAKEAIASVRGSTLFVESPPMTIEDWKAQVAKSHGVAPAPLGMASPAPLGIAPDESTGRTS